MFKSDRSFLPDNCLVLDIQQKGLSELLRAPSVARKIKSYGLFGSNCQHYIQDPFERHYSSRSKGDLSKPFSNGM